jgi:ATP synthase B/B' CF(0)
LFACGRNAQLPAFARPAAIAAVANVLMALPAHAEAGKIFDFNLTLPIMAAEFLVLMVFLDKTWFGPVGALLEERDSELRNKLGSVRDNSGQIAALQAEAEKVLSDARKEAQALIQEAKATTQAECARQLAETKAVRFDRITGLPKTQWAVVPWHWGAKRLLIIWSHQLTTQGVPFHLPSVNF